MLGRYLLLIGVLNFYILINAEIYLAINKATAYLIYI